MEEQDLMFAIFRTVEHITKAELTNIAKTLIYNYYKGSEQESASAKAREAVLRYTQCKSLPLLSDIQKKTRNQLNPFEHLILRMEYEAKKSDGTLAPAAEPEPEPEQYSPPVPPSPVEGAGPFRVDEPVDSKGKSALLPGPAMTPRTRVTQISSGFAGVRTTPRQPAAPSAAPRAGKKASRSSPKKKAVSRPTTKRKPAPASREKTAGRTKAKPAAGRKPKAAPKKKARARRK